VRPVYDDPPDSTVVENLRPDTDEVLAAEGIRGTAADRGESDAGGAAGVEHSTAVEYIRADTDAASETHSRPRST